MSGRGSAVEEDIFLFFPSASGDAGRWAGCRLRGGGRRCYCFSLAAVTLRLVQQVQEVAGGSGFCAQNQRRLHFGLGSATAIEKAVVRWPSGKTQEITAPAPNQVHTLKEPA